MNQTCSELDSFTTQEPKIVWPVENRFQEEDVKPEIAVGADWKRVIYVAGKYKAATEWEQATNISHAGYIARELWKRGWAVLCPAKNSAYFGGILEKPELEEKIWMAGYLELLSRCDAVYFLINWENSHGAMQEYNKAMELGIPIYWESRGDLIQ